ncbi:hypothetical protein HMPREF9088_0515 [Enterococcus italicus DSM 15952]|uniref:Uncharacterized protein n=1 Tax=Enterococcus italicus (strain DSM 15952 / CCUG 50447 / LMG 22039 / TP 1.5) TaxID=888064 RepID=E6LDS5_ENTI1|nr:hypothetical protein HMPREF9088_0515 [Enterococcus italicus DSM 15952]
MLKGCSFFAFLYTSSHYLAVNAIFFGSFNEVSAFNEKLYRKAVDYLE